MTDPIREALERLTETGENITYDEAAESPPSVSAWQKFDVALSAARAALAAPAEPRIDVERWKCPAEGCDLYWHPLDIHALHPANPALQLSEIVVPVSQESIDDGWIPGIGPVTFTKEGE